MFSPAIAHFCIKRPLFSWLTLAPTNRPYVQPTHKNGWRRARRMTDSGDTHNTARRPLHGNLIWEGFNYLITTRQTIIKTNCVCQREIASVGRRRHEVTGVVLCFEVSPCLPPSHTHTQRKTETHTPSPHPLDLFLWIGWIDPHTN